MHNHNNTLQIGNNLTSKTYPRLYTQMDKRRGAESSTLMKCIAGRSWGKDLSWSDRTNWNLPPWSVPLRLRWEGLPRTCRWIAQVFRATTFCICKRGAVSFSPWRRSLLMSHLNIFLQQQIFSSATSDENFLSSLLQRVETFVKGYTHAYRKYSLWSEISFLTVTHELAQHIFWALLFPWRYLMFGFFLTDSRLKNEVK